MLKWQRSDFQLLGMSAMHCYTSALPSLPGGVVMLGVIGGGGLGVSQAAASVGEKEERRKTVTQIALSVICQRGAMP